MQRLCKNKLTTSSSVPPKSRPANRFEILSIRELMEEKLFVTPRIEEEVLVELRKTRAASARVAELMNSLKLRNKSSIDKGKNKHSKVEATILGGQPSL